MLLITCLIASGSLYATDFRRTDMAIPEGAGRGGGGGGAVVCIEGIYGSMFLFI